MSDSANLMIKDRPKSWWAQTKLRSTEQRLLTKKEKSCTLNCNDVAGTGYPEVEPGPHHCGRVSTKAADGPRSGTTLLGWPTPLGFSLKHNCSCSLHHWKLQYNIKSVGLWMVVYVFLVASVTRTWTWPVGQRLGNYSGSAEWPHSKCGSIPRRSSPNCPKHQCPQANVNLSKTILKS